GNILTVQNNTTSLNVTTPQTLLTISSTGSLTINNATTSMTVKGSVNDATNLAGPYSVFVSGRYAYVAAYDSDRLTVVDVSNPSSPTVVGNVTDATNLYGAISVFVSGRYAYLTSYLDDRLTVVDVSNPSSPTVVGSINDTTNLFSSSSVFVSGRYAYVTAELGNRLTVVDVSNPSSPRVVGSINDATNLNQPRSVFVSGRYAYVAASTGNRLTVVDVSNPSSPTVVGNVNDATNLNSPQSVFVSGRYAYVAASTGNRLTVVDVSNPSSPSVVGNVNDATNLNGPRSVFVSGRYAYVAVGTGNRLTVVDVSIPSSPTMVGSINDDTNLNVPRSVFVSGRYAYVAAYTGNRLTVVELPGIDVPTVLTGSIQTTTLDTWSFANIGSDLYVRGGIVAGPGGIMTNGAFTVNATTTTAAGGTNFFSINPYPYSANTGFGFITASSSATSTTNFFTASATVLTTGDLFRGVLGAPATGNFLSFTQGELANGHRFKLSATGLLSASSTATTQNFFTASATAITSGDLFRGVLGAPATANANFLSFSVGETPNNRRFALNSQGAISASSTVTGTNFFNVTATAITTGDLFKFTVPGTTGTGQAWTGNILTVRNNTTSIGATTPQTLLTISSTGSVTINNATTSATIKGSVQDGTNLSGISGVFVSGRYAYAVANGTARLTVVDISNPASPTVSGSVVVSSSGSLAEADLFVSGRYAYVGVDEVFGTDGFAVVDISNPTAPVLVALVTDSTQLNGARGIFVSGRYAYVAAQADRLTVVDVSNPANPAIVGSVTDATQLDGTENLFVSGRYAYMAAPTSDRLTVVDVSNPANPAIVGSVTDATQLDSALDVFVSGRYAYVVAYNTNRLTIVDVSNPASPTIVGSVADTPQLRGPYSVFVSGRYAYVTANTNNRLTMVDVSTPATPVVVGSVYDVTQLIGAYDVNVSGRYAYIAVNTGNRLTIVELAGIDVPTVLTGSVQTTTLDTWSFANIGSDLYVRGGIVGGPGGIMTNGAFSVSATTTTGLGGTYFSIQPFPETGPPGTSSVTSTPFISASSTVTVSNFFAATATSLTSGNFMKWVVPTSAFTADALRLEDNASTPNVLFRIGPTGNVTTTQNLTLNSRNPFIQWAPTTAGDKLSIQSGTTTLASLDIGGTWVTKGPQTPNGTPDVAEMITVADDVEPFDLVVADPANPEYVRRTSQPYDPKILGVITAGGSAITLGNTGFIATGEDVRRMPIVLAGRIPVNVTTENGPIAVGDRLTSSSKPGHAMKATQAGPTVGIALEPFGESGIMNQESREGTVLIFLNVGYNAPLTVNAELATNPFASLPVPPQDAIIIAASQNFNGQSLYNLAAIYGLNWRIDERGDLQAEQVGAGEFVVRRKVNPAESTVGEGLIPAGAIEARVASSKVQAATKVFLTFRDDLAGRSWYIASIEPGQAFTVRLSVPADRDLSFGYWLLGVVGQGSVPVAPAAPSPTALPTPTDSQPQPPTPSASGDEAGAASSVAPAPDTNADTPESALGEEPLEEESQTHAATEPESEANTGVPETSG
ncbi:hypothetical protein HY573_02805, partial [Candidatus Parcubacteria bacterium]|nr:hypothetical protein [Candidatus Parcubacteria bacterium]